MDNADREKIEKIISDRKAAHAFYVAAGSAERRLGKLRVERNAEQARYCWFIIELAASISEA